MFPSSINRPKSVKILVEETEDLELELARNEVECRGVLGTAKAEARDLTAAENHRFNISVNSLLKKLVFGDFRQPTRAVG